MRGATWTLCANSWTLWARPSRLDRSLGSTMSNAWRTIPGACGDRGTGPPTPPAPNRTTGSTRFDQAQLRHHLVRTARERRTVTYGEVAALFNFQWSQGVGSALYAVLNRLAEENQDRQEPYLMALVVSRRNRLPGPGFFNLVGHGPNSDIETYHKQFLEEVWAFDWPDQASPRRP